MCLWYSGWSGRFRRQRSVVQIQTGASCLQLLFTFNFIKETKIKKTESNNGQLFSLKKSVFSHPFIRTRIGTAPQSENNPLNEPLRFFGRRRLQCDQIWRKFATFAKILKSLANI